MDVSVTRVIFSGWVQGVGFRATALRFARELSISGTAKNLSDGTVEIFAQGTEKQLDQFFDQLLKRFPNSQIVLQEEKKSSQAFNEFTIV